MPIDDQAPAIHDDCQAGEGEIGQVAAIRLYRCSRCRATLVVASCPDGVDRLRNAHDPKPVKDPASFAGSA